MRSQKFTRENPAYLLQGRRSIETFGTQLTASVTHLIRAVGKRGKKTDPYFFSFWVSVRGGVCAGKMRGSVMAIDVGGNIKGVENWDEDEGPKVCVLVSNNGASDQFVGQARCAVKEVGIPDWSGWGKPGCGVGAA